MAKRVVIAISQREYAAKLTEYLREEQPEWDIAAFTQGIALRRELQEGKAIDLLIAHQDWLQEMDEMNVREEHAGKVMVLVKEKSHNAGKWQQILQYQPLPTLLSCIREGVEGQSAVMSEGCQVLSLFSASGGIGKTTIALNLIRQAGERGLRTFYLNLEALNATSLLFGKGEPDSLSQLLYRMQNHPEEGVGQLEQLCRHSSVLRTDFLDAPDHPGERLALKPELLTILIDGIRNTGRYDLIVLDPDSGAGDWHRCLVEKSDRMVWVTIDDMQCLMKADKLLRYWKEQLGEGGINKILFVLNKGHGGRMVNRWELPGTSPSAVLPYIPQWKAMDQPSRLLGAPAFAGAVEQLMGQLGIGRKASRLSSWKEGEGNGIQQSDIRGAG
jgi:MinD-like ATPase involved in chromosome partitioning or flagellar assembly